MRHAATWRQRSACAQHLQLGEGGDVERAEAVEAPHHLRQCAQHRMPHHPRHPAKPQRTCEVSNVQSLHGTTGRRMEQLELVGTAHNTPLGE